MTLSGFILHIPPLHKNPTEPQQSTSASHWSPHIACGGLFMVCHGVYLDGHGGWFTSIGGGPCQPSGHFGGHVLAWDEAGWLAVAGAVVEGAGPTLARGVADMDGAGVTEGETEPPSFLPGQPATNARKTTRSEGARMRTWSSGSRASGKPDSSSDQGAG
jgi:hypothetical protein